MQGHYQNNYMNVYFSDWFDIDPQTLEDYGAFNISLINDLPLFIDPFLLFTSDKEKYKYLHDQMIHYLRFLRDKSVDGQIENGLVRAWFTFPEVKQLWLGYSLHGNDGSGLGMDFAKALNNSLHVVFKDFGEERITKGSHLEKVCLVQSGVGRDNISDFTANLIKHFLLEYTQDFALQNIAPVLRKRVKVEKVLFDYDIEVWKPLEFELPYLFDDYVLLCPKDILTKTTNWINRESMIDSCEQIINAVPDEQLRSQINNYLTSQLKKGMKKREQKKLHSSIFEKFPQLIEHYILYKENRGNEAKNASKAEISDSELQYVENIGKLVEKLLTETKFYQHGIDTLNEARARVMFLKNEIENNGAYRLFYHKGQPVQRESDLQIIFRLTWYATPSDFNSEVNNGRGPVDFKISRGSKDSTLVEFKLAKNKKLKINLQNQIEIYKRANKTDKALKVIFYFSDQEKKHVENILDEIDMRDDDSIILVDVRSDNKPSASNASES